MFTTSSLIDAADGTRGSLVLPHFGGGSNWEGGAADPETGMLYVASQTTINVFAVNAAGDRSDIRYLFVNGDAPHPLGLPLIKPPYGRITAIDMNTGEHRWMVPNGDTPDDVKNNPALAGVKLPPTGKPSKALLLVTKTLLFAAEGYGGGPILRAYDKATRQSRRGAAAARRRERQADELSLRRQAIHRARGRQEIIRRSSSRSRCRRRDRRGRRSAPTSASLVARDFRCGRIAAPVAAGGHALSQAAAEIDGRGSFVVEISASPRPRAHNAARLFPKARDAGRGREVPLETTAVRPAPRNAEPKFWARTTGR